MGRTIQKKGSHMTGTDRIIPNLYKVGTQTFHTIQACLCVGVGGAHIRVVN